MNARSLQQKIAATGLALMSAAGLHAGSVMQSPHNLSSSGPGSITASHEADVCIFCHTSHNAPPKTPLWNHASSGATYTTYTSSTTKATIGQPTGASKLCLSCHDGTVALGSINNLSKPITMNNGVTTMPKGQANLGTDLSSDHPISFVYDLNLAAKDPQLRNPTALPHTVKLDANHQVQCTTCHDPHNDQFGNFLVQNNSGSALCLNCHSPSSWSTSVHAVSAAKWNGQGANPWPRSTSATVSANGCENCHTSHNAGGKARLLAFSDSSQTCYVCHAGTVAAKNIQVEFNKISVHPVALTASLHDPMEDVIKGPRHAACADCHNPHATTAAQPLLNVTGANLAGTVVTSAGKEYELCFRCHGDSPNKMAALVSRVAPQTNKRLQFQPSNASFHPVASAGRNPQVPSLIAPYTTASVINCTDCHNNDQGPNAGGSGPDGPHGSAYPPLLERQLVLTDNSPESGAAYALCYKCHGRSSILANQSFPGHADHIVKYQTACTTCHDSHGVATKPGLINFNTAYVTAGPAGRISFTPSGINGGNCTLTCHGAIHNNLSYENSQSLLRRIARH